MCGFVHAAALCIDLGQNFSSIHKEKNVLPVIFEKMKLALTDLVLY